MAAEDKHGQTVVHYAARRGQLAILKYIRSVPAQRASEDSQRSVVTLEMENSYGLTPIVYALMNCQFNTFVYLRFKMRCKLTEERASWTVTQLIKQGVSAPTPGFDQAQAHQQRSKESILWLLMQEENGLGDAVA